MEINRTSKDRHHFAAIILAAGFSSRMGRFKPLLPMGDETLIEKCIKLFQGVGIAEIMVVAGFDAQKLIPVVTKLDARYVINPAYSTGMLTSIKAGIHALIVEMQGNRKMDRSSFFILPVDIPLVRPQTLLSMINAFHHDNRPIIYPTFGGKRGHPPLIDSSLAPEIEAWTGNGGLRSFLATREHLSVDIKVPDSFILMDCDTLADYRMLLDHHDSFDSLTEEECRALMAQYRHPAHPISKHCEAVSRVAATIAQALNISGLPIDEDLIVAAALLHDIMRDRPGHARAAANLFTRLGYLKVADIVGAHMDIQIDEETPVNTREVVYLADKLVSEDQMVMLEKRFSRRTTGLKGPEARKAFETRRENAFRIKARIENQIARPLESILELPPSADGVRGGACDLPD